jgi:peroxiredoxin
MNNPWVAKCFMVIAAVAVSVSSPAQAATPGIALAAKAPLALPLRDAQGAATSLAKQMGAKGIVLVMVRSASWCPYCKVQISELNTIRADIAKRGYALAALSYDKPDVLAGFAKAKSVGFPLLSDTGSKMIDALALRDPQYASVAFANGVPYASILVIGRDGAVKAKQVSGDYKVRPSNAQVLALIDNAAR